MLSYLTYHSINKATTDNKVSRSTAWLWISRYLETGDVHEKKSTGRNRSMSTRASAHARALLLTGDYSAEQVAEELHVSGETPRVLNNTIICRNAKQLSKDMGSPIRAVRGIPQRELDKTTTKKREDYCRAYINQDWRSVMFTDCKRFLFKYVRSRMTRVTWVERGQRRSAKCVNHPQGLNIYLGLIPHGLTSVHFVTGTSKMTSPYMSGNHPARSITTGEYMDVLTHTMLPEGARLFTPFPSWAIQQDNDPCHKRGGKDALAAWNADHPHHIVSLLDGWPPHSGDLSQIENVWGMHECEVDAMVLSTLDEYKAAVLLAVKNFPQSKIDELYRSMHDRMQQCIHLKGDKTRY